MKTLEILKEKRVLLLTKKESWEKHLDSMSDPETIDYYVLTTLYAKVDILSELIEEIEQKIV